MHPAWFSLLVAYILPVCALLTPCHAGASAPRMAHLFPDGPEPRLAPDACRPAAGRAPRAAGAQTVNEDKASRYHRLKRRASVVALVWSVVFLAGLLATGLSIRLRDVAEAAGTHVGPRPLAALAVIVVYVGLLSLLSEIVGLPLAFYRGFLLERHYGMSTEPAGRWLYDQGKAFGVGLVFGSGAAGIVYALIRSMPDHWWLVAGAAFALVFVGLAKVVPVVVLPLFYTVKPLEREGLRRRLLDLARRAGTTVVDAYEWGLGSKTRKANAALAGLGSSRRILVSDTMLIGFSDDEIEVVFAHEIAHHVHGDVWKGLAFESLLTLAGFYLAARLLAWLAAPAGLRDVGDLAGLPLLLLAGGAVSLVTAPVALAMSRSYERAADRFALDLTQNPSAFVSAMRRLGAQNLAELDPSPLVQWLFYSHPPLRERIAAAQAFKGGRPDDQIGSSALGP